MAPVTVEKVGKGLPRQQFADLAVALHAGHPGVEWLLAGQRRRLLRGPLPEREAVLLLARRHGRPVARLTAHRQADGSASFGFLAVEGPGELEAVEALISAARSWLVTRVTSGTTMVGPLSWTAADEAGVLVEGHGGPPVTGRAWNPAWYRDLLEGAGLEVAEESCSYRLAAEEVPGAVALTPGPFAVAADVRPFADPALMLALPGGGGAIVAVPDVAGGLSAGTGRRGAWAMARQARHRDWVGCVVTALDGPESVLVPGLCAAAARAGYQWVLSPWAPDDRAPVMRHRLYRTHLGDGAEGRTVGPPAD